MWIYSLSILSLKISFLTQNTWNKINRASQNLMSLLKNLRFMVKNLKKNQLKNIVMKNNLWLCKVACWCYPQNPLCLNEILYRLLLDSKIQHRALNLQFQNTAAGMRIGEENLSITVTKKVFQVTTLIKNLLWWASK